MKIYKSQNALNIVLMLLLTISLLYNYNNSDNYFTSELKYKKSLDSIESKIKTKEAIISVLTKKNSYIKLQLIESTNNLKYIHKTIVKYEKISDTIYLSPIKRDSISASRIKFYLQNRDRFSIKRFSINK